MIPSLAEFLAIDLAAVVTACLCAATCAIVGSFLVLRRQALLGDSIAHSVLPGLAAAFLIVGSRGSVPMFIGALVAGIISTVLSEGLRRIARVESGAAMGVVFSTMFALGVLLMSLPRMRTVDLDADCVLNGVLETVVWTADTARGTRVPTTLADLLDPGVLAGAPQQLVTALVVFVVVGCVVLALYKELTLASFDGGLAAALGFPPWLLHTVLVVLAASASVASFEVVGSILVIAMLICPAASARMCTDRLTSQIAVAVLFSVLSVLSGYCAAAFGPGLVGFPGTTLSAAGMITVAAGLLLVAAILLAPVHGLLARSARTFRLGVTIAREDLLAMLYRVEESNPHQTLRRDQVIQGLGGGVVARSAIRSALSRGEIVPAGHGLTLTDPGRAAARALVRTHRLWESYLVHELGLRPDHVHRAAMDLEHHTTPAMVQDLASAVPSVTDDPHGRRIPDAGLEGSPARSARGNGPEPGR